MTRSVHTREGVHQSPAVVDPQAAWRYAALDPLSLVLLQPDPFPLLLERTVATVSRMLGCDAVWLLKGVDPQDPTVCMAADFGAAEIRSDIKARLPIPPEARAMLERTIASDNATSVSGVNGWPSSPTMPTVHQLWIPVWADEQKPWILGVERGIAAHPFLDGERELLEAASDRIASALYLRLEQERLRRALEAKAEALLAADVRLRSLLDASPDLICIKDGEGRWLQTNLANLRLFDLEGVAYEGFTDQELAAYTEPHYSPAFQACFESDEAIWQSRKSALIHETIPNKDGEPRVFEVIKVPCFASDGSRYGLVVISRDVTERERSEIDRRIAAAAMEATGEAILVTDEIGRIVKTNASYETIFRRRASEVSGALIADVSRVGLPKELTRILPQALSQPWAGELLAERSGEEFPVWAAVNPVQISEDTQHLVISVSDISELRASEAQVTHLSRQDVLTGLLNRSGFDDTLRERLRSGQDMTVYALNIDGFKAVNDSLGTSAGDAILIEVGNRLRQAFQGVPLARIGADDFMLALPPDTQNEPDSVGEQLQRLRSAPVRTRDVTVFISWSVGVASSEDGKLNAAQIIANAAAALHQAKARGPGSLRRYEKRMTVSATERLDLETGLRRLIARGGPDVHYQPIVDPFTGFVVGIEALARWNHPQRGMIRPDRFIALAESSGLIVPLGQNVLYRACEVSMEWLKAGIDIGYIAVNISAKQIDDPAFALTVVDCLERTGLPPTRLVLEVTESVVMSQPDEAIRTLTGLRARGIGLAIDDFGTGFSSLAHLKQLPITKLKLDQSFVRGLPSNSQDFAITRAVQALGQSLNLSVTVEGVETHAQLACIKGLGISAVQGFLLGRPAPPEAIDFSKRTACL